MAPTVVVDLASSTTTKHPVPRVSGARLSEDSTKKEGEALPYFLTADETAALLRTTRSAIYAMAERGRLAGVTRVGRRLLVSRDALLRSLFEGRAPSPRGTRR